MAFGSLWPSRAGSEPPPPPTSSRSSRGDLVVHGLSPLQQPLHVTSTPATAANNLCLRINRHRQPSGRTSGNSTLGHPGVEHQHRSPWWKSWTKKYVILCCLCGGTAVLLGLVFLVIYFVLSHYTTSLHYFETIPTYAPALVLIVTGLLVTCFARRRNRYAYLIKIAGGCCLMCALLCVVITVTTTVIHMNRLQTLRECVYTKKSKTCTCFAGIGDDEGAARYVFNDTPDCEVVHGGLYTCLRAVFGLSVVGILVCIFSSMLVYQLLSHEKKKMYWEQLEMRRRFFYRQSTHPLYCNCYDDYGFTAPTPHDLYHWQPWEVNSDRCWPSRGIAPRLGFGVSAHEDGGGCGGSQRSILIGSTGHRASGWNWLPWSRSRPSQVSCANNQSDTNSSVYPMIIAHADPMPSTDGSSSVHHPAFPAHHHLHHHHHPLSYWSADQHCATTTASRHASGSSRRGGGSGHRRRRSNDAIFHHMNMTPPFVTDASYAPSYSTYANMAHHHLWGPPPPYSRPPSAENVNCSGGGTPRGRLMSGMAPHSMLPVGAQQQQQQLQPIMMIQTSAEDITANLLPPVVRDQEDKPSSNDIFVDMHHSYSSDYETSRVAKRILVSGTVPPPSRQREVADSESNCSKSAPQICIWPSESCLMEIVSGAIIRKEGRRRGMPVAREDVVDDDSEPCTGPSSSSSEGFEVEVDEDDDDNFRTSMMVSTAPSTPIMDDDDDVSPSSYLVDMTMARSLPNLSLSLGPLSSVDNGAAEDKCTRTDETHVEVDFADVHPSMADVQFPVSSTTDAVQNRCQPVGLSDSSPALLPLRVPTTTATFFRTETQDEQDAARRYLSSIENLFQRHCVANYLDTAASNGFKSKSLGNLTPKDNIIVTFKSIHV